MTTVAAIEHKLLRDGLLLRNVPNSRKAKQGAFLACSFWLAEVYVMQGRTNDARTLFTRLLGLANDVGLLPEEYDTTRKRLVGNFPQAFSHIAWYARRCDLPPASEWRRLDTFTSSRITTGGAGAAHLPPIVPSKRDIVLPKAWVTV